MSFCRCSGVILTWGDGNLSAFYCAINLPANSLSIYTDCKTGMIPLSEDLISNKKEIVRCDFAEKSLLLLQSYQKDVPKWLRNAEMCLGAAIDLINLVVSASEAEGDNG